jgi:deazaflavin-dependent oxidoreductase (nitroreductase family)
MRIDKSPSLIATKEAQLQQAFKKINRFMVFIWRLGWGRYLNFWPAVVGRMMVIVNIGRTSGQKRFSPVNYAIINDDVYCCAGFGTKTDWYRNIQKTPQVEIWLPGSRWEGIATDVSEDPSRISYLRTVLISSGFAASTFGDIKPRKASDAELAEKTSDYRLIRIQRVRRLTGSGGPGDFLWLSWLIHIVTVAVIALIIWLIMR